MAKTLVQRTFSINTANDLLVRDYYEDGTQEDVSSLFQHIAKSPGDHRVRVYVDLDFGSDGQVTISGAYASQALVEAAEVEADKRIVLDVLKTHHPEALKK